MSTKVSINWVGLLNKISKKRDCLNWKNFIGVLCPGFLYGISPPSSDLPTSRVRRPGPPESSLGSCMVRETPSQNGRHVTHVIVMTETSDNTSNISYCEHFHRSWMVFISRVIYNWYYHFICHFCTRPPPLVLIFRFIQTYHRPGSRNCDRPRSRENSELAGD